MADTGGKNDGCSKFFVTKKFENAFARSWSEYADGSTGVLGLWNSFFSNVKELFSDFQSSLLQVMSSELFFAWLIMLFYDILADVLHVSHCHAIFAQVEGGFSLQHEYRHSTREIQIVV